MKYFSCFSGIGGFELGIINAYEQMMCSADSQEKVQGTRDKDGQPLECPHIGTEGLSCNNSYANNRPDILNRSEILGQNMPDSEERKIGITCVGFSEIDKYATQIYKSHFPNHPEYGDITKINAEELPNFDCLVGGFPCQSFSIAGKRGGFSDTRGTLFFEIARILKAKQPRLFVLENVKGLLSHDNGNTFKVIISTLTELGYDLQWQVINSKNHGVPQNRERVYIIGHLRGSSRPKVFPFGTVNKMGNRENQDANTLTSNYWKGPAASRPIPTDGSRIRRLTPVECERLQGFPDNWTECVSDTQRYKCCGNAVTTNVVRDIFTSILGTALALPAEVQNSSQSENMRSATNVSESTPE